MATLTQCSKEWAKRPADQRYLSINAMHFDQVQAREESKELVVPLGKLIAQAEGGELVITGGAGIGYAPSHYTFSSLAGKVSAPAHYLRNLPAPLAVECLNHSIQTIGNEEVGIRLRQQRNDNGEISRQLNSLNGPKYGRIWNSDITGLLLSRGIDGVNGDWIIPGEFGKKVEISKKNTTLFSSDRDMFIFLADEENRIEIPNRRNGESGLLSRGFFIKNSEVGAAKLTVTTFLFDYVCSNRMVWGAEEVMEVSIRHSANAPGSWLDKTMPALTAYHNASTRGITEGILAAQNLMIEKDEMTNLLGNIVGKRQVETVRNQFMAEESRPMCSLFDAVSGLTSYSQGIEYQDERMLIDMAAGALMEKVAPKVMNIPKVGEKTITQVPQEYSDLSF